TEDLADILAGTYTVTVTDANGCTATATAIVSEPSPVDFSIDVEDVLCYAESTGSIDVSNVSGGVSPYTYLWSNSATTQDLVNIPAGTYSVTVSDANGCSVSVNQSVSQPALLSISQISLTDVNYA